MSNSEYLGISKSYQSEIKRSSSKFIGFLLPVLDESEFDKALSKFREDYSDASHVCYAVILNTDRSFQKFSDDGEPSNSAGRPILNALLSSGSSYIMAVVIRYFGGKKLGIPGLIEAYGAAIAECLDQAEIKQRILMDTIRCKIAPQNQHLLFNFLNQEQLEYSFDHQSFEIRSSQSLTDALRTSLVKIPTLLLLT